MHLSMVLLVRNSKLPLKGGYWISQNFLFSMDTSLVGLLYRYINSFSDKNGNPDHRGLTSLVNLLCNRLEGDLVL